MPTNSPRKQFYVEFMRCLRLKDLPSMVYHHLSQYTGFRMVQILVKLATWLPRGTKPPQSKRGHAGQHNDSWPWNRYGQAPTWPGGHLASAFYKEHMALVLRDYTYKHRLDYVFPNRLTVSNHSTALLNEEYSPYVWTGGLGRLTHTHTHALSRLALQGTDRGTEGHKKNQGGREKEREMSFKWHPHCEVEQDDGTLQNC